MQNYKSQCRAAAMYDILVNIHTHRQTDTHHSNSFCMKARAKNSRILRQGGADDTLIAELRPLKKCMYVKQDIRNHDLIYITSEQTCNLAHRDPVTPWPTLSFL